MEGAEEGEEEEELVDSGVVATAATSTSSGATSSGATSMSSGTTSTSDLSPLAEAIANIQRAQAEHQLLRSTATASQHQIRELEGKCRELAELKKSAEAEVAKLKRDLAALQKKEKESAVEARDQEAVARLTAEIERVTAEKEKLSADLGELRRQFDNQTATAKQEVGRLTKDVERLRSERNRYGDEATELRRKMDIIGGLIPTARGGTPPRGEKRPAPDHDGRADGREKRSREGQNGSFSGSPGRGGPSNLSPRHLSPRHGPPRDPRFPTPK